MRLINSLYFITALETEVAMGKDFLIKRDGIDHGSSEWFTFATNIESKGGLAGFRQIRCDITAQIPGRLGLDK
jgi:hypothetical protein